MKLRIRFTKLDQSIYLSHLDLQRIFQLVLKKSNMGVIYSKGFNPHMKMSFVSALSVGIGSICECVDIDCEYEKIDNYNTIIERINNNFIPGIRVISIRELDFEKEKKELFLLDSCDYIFEFTFANENIKNEFTKFLSRDNISYIKTSKKNIQKEVNLKEGILDYKYIENANEIKNLSKEYMVIDENNIYFYLKLSAGNNNLSPSTLLKAFMENIPDVRYNLYRIKMLNKYNNEIY